MSRKNNKNSIIKDMSYRYPGKNNYTKEDEDAAYSYLRSNGYGKCYINRLLERKYS